MESVAAWVFTVVSAVGLITSVLLLSDTWQDKKALEALSKTPNGKFIIVKSSMRTQAVKSVVFALFLIAGLSIVTVSTPPPGVFRMLLAAGAMILLGTNSVLEYLTKKKLLSN